MYSQVLSLVLGFVAVHSVTAQDPSITQIEIPPLGFIAAGDHFFGTIKWTEPRDIMYYKSHGGNVELLAGAKDSPTSNVVDIVTLNEDLITSIFLEYDFPRSLPQGPYHFRVNFTNSSVSALSDTFTVNAPSSNNCNPPAAWVNVSSTSDPNYRVLRIVEPSAGSANSIKYSDDLMVEWAYRDQRNSKYYLGSLQKGQISGVTFEYVSPGGGSILVQPGESLTNSVYLPLNASSVNVGEWRIRVNYTNSLEGGVPLSSLSEAFYFTTSSKCDGTEQPASSGGGGDNGTRTGNGDGPFGRPNTADHLRKRPLESSRLICLQLFLLGLPFLPFL